MNKQILTGIGCGAIATIAMSTGHFLARRAHLFPIWKPLPLAVVLRIFGSGMPRPLILVLAIGSHLVYGGFWGGVLWATARRITIWKGIGMGVFLWLILQLLIFPFLGWGLFASRVTPRIVLPTLIEHLIYGTTLGWLGTRTTTPATA